MASAEGGLEGIAVSETFPLGLILRVCRYGYMDSLPNSWDNTVTHVKI